MAELHTASDVCRRWGISRAVFQDWKRDPTFPDPVPWTPELRAQYDPRTRHLWDGGQIAAWRKRKQDARHNRRKNALRAYRRRAGETGHLSATAHAFDVSVVTLRRWARDAGLELPRAGR
jgi:hypothetical protein